MDEPPIYLDNLATTRCDPEVVEGMIPYFVEHYGNAASRSHRFGADARSATEEARARIASLIGASPKEIVFTSGATEANNLAILGVARHARATVGKDHVVTWSTEHPAVLDPMAALGRQGFDVTVLPVGSDGRVDLGALEHALRPTTALVSVMAVNNEIGVTQPLDAIAAMCRSRGVLTHCDAAQATYYPIDTRTLPVDLLSLSAHKMYGPKGIGALYVRRSRPRVELEPLVYGGGHERGMRSGTLPVPSIVGMGLAAQKLARTREEELPRVAALRDRLWSALASELDGVEINGDPVRRAPNNLNVSFDGVEAAALLIAVRDVVALSTGSACSSEALSPSHVLTALGGEPTVAQRSVRFGVGRFTTKAEIDRVAAAVVEAVRSLRRHATLYEGGYGPTGGP
ncbi:MAG: aminotransferase class V-fold PLP-dependent enzyme [Myxococcota bacterium]